MVDYQTQFNQVFNINNEENSPMIYDNPFTEDSDMYFDVAEHAPMWKGTGWFDQNYLNDPQPEYHSDSNYKMLVRTDTNEVLGIHGSDYSTIQNRDFFTHIEEHLVNEFDPLELQGLKIEDSISDGGKVCVRQYLFPKFSKKLTTTNGHETTIQLRLIGWNCFDGSSKARIIFGDIDMFCTNGMIIGEKNVVAKKRSKNFELSSLTHSFSSMVDAFDHKINLYREWAMKPVTIREVEVFFENAFKTGREKKDGTYENTQRFIDTFKQESAVRGQNIWAVVSAMTNYSSHTDNNWKLNKQSEGKETIALNKRQEQVQKVMSSDPFKQLAYV